MSIKTNLVGQSMWVGDEYAPYERSGGTCGICGGMEGGHSFECATLNLDRRNIDGYARPTKPHPILFDVGDMDGDKAE